jgi:hypothetical protein
VTDPLNPIEELFYLQGRENSESLLHLAEKGPLDSSLQPSLLQTEVDNLVSRFDHEAAQWKSLASILAGGMAYRMGRIGVVSSGVAASRWVSLGDVAAAPLQALSVGTSLVAEASAFELTNRSLTFLTGETYSNPDLWRWEGRGGIRQGLLSSLINFGSLKGCGKLVQGENIVLQHLLQDTGMVLGHQATAVFGLMPAPTGSIAEQYLHAETTNLQVGAGMALAHSFSPGIQGIERGLDLSLRAMDVEARFPRPGAETAPLQIGSQPALAAAGGRENILLMSSSGESGKPGGPVTPQENPAKEGDVIPTSNSEAETPRAPLVTHGVLSRLVDRRVYTAQLLRFSRDHLLNLIQEGLFSEREGQMAKDWLREVKEVQEMHNSELLELSGVLGKAERSGHLDNKLTAKIKEGEEAAYSLLRRVRLHIERSRELLSRPLTFQSAAEVRRRMDWVLSLPEFSVDFDWRSSPLADHLDPAAFGPVSAHEMGRDLLIRLHPAVSQEDIDLYERAAQGIIRGRDIAFDLNKTLVGTFLGYNMDSELKNHPKKYNGTTFDYFAHQTLLLRTPYRGMEALLLGLWAAGNRLSLYTSDRAAPTHLNTLFNDFPLLKIPFGLAAPEDPFPLVSSEDLHRSDRIMDEEKREEFQRHHFGHAEGEEFLGALRKEIGVKDLSFMKNSKIPFPDFPFEVLVDDSDYWPGELQTLGFGRRWILATGSAEATLRGLEEYFSKPLPETSSRMRTWLSGRANSSTLPPTAFSQDEGGQIIDFEQARSTGIATRLKPLQGYFAQLGVAPDLFQRALAPDGTMRDKAILICEAVVKQYFLDNYSFHPERHPPLAKILEILKKSDPLKKEVQSIFAEAPKEHVYNFLKVPLSPYFWMK